MSFSVSLDFALSHSCCRLTLLVHHFLLCKEIIVSHLEGHTAPLRHKALSQSYLCLLSPDKGALTLHRHQAFIGRMAVFD